MLMSHGLRSLFLKTFPKNLISMYYSVAVINDSTFPEVKYLWFIAVFLFYTVSPEA